MNTIDQIKSELLDVASSANIQGVTVDALCSLLSYSIYKNQLLQARLNLEGSFTTSTSLNSRIHHAANLLYSVFRGKCPRIVVSNFDTVQKVSFEKLDQAFTYGGFYFYYAEGGNFTISADDPDNEGSTSQTNEVTYICAANRSKTCTLDSSSIRDDLYFLDFIDENMSEDMVFRAYSGDTSYTELSYTEDINQFYRKVDTEDSETGSAPYVYDYLVVTIPSYGVRLMRHADQPWGFSRVECVYLPYSETVPDFGNLRSIPALQFRYDSSSSGATLSTQIQTYGFEAREDENDDIYSKAVESYHTQGTVATTYDLITFLRGLDSSAYFKVYNDTKLIKSESADESDPDNYYTVEVNPAVTTVVYSNLSDTITQSYLESQIEGWKTSLSVTKNIELQMAISSVPVVVQVDAYSSSMVLTNEMISQVTGEYQKRIGESLSHSDFEADIIRLGFTYVKTYVSGQEWTDAGSGGVITCKEWMYPSINATVKV